METRSAGESVILYAAGLIAVAIVVLNTRNLGAASIIWTTVAAAVTLVAVMAGGRYVMSSRYGHRELSGGEDPGQVTGEYRRLADIAVIAREHTELKLSEFAAQLDDMRGQIESMRRVREIE
jgi:hypothetical protein